MERQNERIRQFAKHVFNPIVIKFAGATYSPFALLSHFGRKSGKSFKTPLVVRRAKHGFVIALPYGPEVDWYRNIVAVGQASLRWHGHDYDLAKPIPIPKEKGLKAFAPPARTMLMRLKVHDFVLVPGRPGK